MEFSSNIQKSFKYLSDSLSTGEYSELVKYVFESFIISTKSGKFVVDLKADKFNFGNQIDLKNAIAAVYTVICEMVKNGLDSNSLSTFMEDFGFENDRIEIFKEHYERMYSIIRLFLSSSEYSFPHVIDVKWRLDNHVKEDSLEKINEPIYLIDLIVEKCGQDDLSKIQFSCSVEQLQEFVYKLKEATKHLEKLAQI